MDKSEKPIVFSKRDLYTKYYKVPERFLRETINEIISKCRSISLEQAKRKHSITPKECKLFYAEMDGF